MSRSEFRWNKKRKHYAYLFKDVNHKCKNILISSSPIMVEKQNKKKVRVTNNIPLFRHPNKNKYGQYYLIPRVYLDGIECFDDKKYSTWSFDKNDKRKIKRMKKSRLRHQSR